MALAFRLTNRNCFYTYHLSLPVRHIVHKIRAIRVLSSAICFQDNVRLQRANILPAPFRQLATDCSCPNNVKPPEEPEGKKGLIKRLKEMYRDYWYVVVPVHLVTSAIWFGSFYYAVRSGVDVIAILKSIGVSESIIAPLRDSSAGYVALTFAMYKLASPLRYAVTVGGTTYAIKKLTTIGWIKPVPSPRRIKEMIQEKKGNIEYRFNESKQHYQDQVKEKSSLVMDEMRRYKTEMRNMKDKMKKL